MVKTVRLPYLFYYVVLMMSLAHATTRSETLKTTNNTTIKTEIIDSLGFAPAWLKLDRYVVLPTVPDNVLEHGSRQIKKVALTFDACATSKASRYDEKVIKILVDSGTKATIFLGGKWMEEKPEQTKYLASIPFFELGNHTFLHPHMTRIPVKRMQEELRWTQKVLYALTGKQAHLFRPPFGEYSSTVVHVAASMGLTTVEYDLPSGDPDVHATKEKLVEYVTTMARNGSIIVMHINGRGWHTAEALPDIISGLARRGFSFVTVSELLSDLAKSLNNPLPPGLQK